MPAGNLDDVDLVAERDSIRVDLIFAHEAELACVDEQRRYAQRFRRWRRSRELAVHRYHRALAVPKTPEAVRVLYEVLAHLLLQELEWRRRAGVDPFRDRILLRPEGAVGALAFGEVVADVGKELDRGVEQRGPLDAVRYEHSELENDPAPERVTDPKRAVHAGGVERFEHVVRMGGERPRRFPAGRAVSAQIRSEYAVAGREPLLGELAKPSSVSVHAVQADDGGCGWIAPLVQVELH